MDSHRLSVDEAYDILGLDESASLEEVKVAYKQLALRTHPDKNPDNPEATARFQQIGAAYDRLLRHLDDSFSDGSDIYEEDSEDEIPLSFYVFLYEEMMRDRASRHSRMHFSRFSHQPEHEPEEVYQARLQREREERAAAEERRRRNEQITKNRKIEEREKVMEEAARRRKNKAKEKKMSSEESKRLAEQTMRRKMDEAQTKRSDVFKAARSGQDEIVKKGIWELGVDAAGYENKTSGPGDTLLHIAVSRNSLDLVSWLDAHSAEPEERDGSGLTPFMLAVKLGNIEIMNDFFDSHSTREEKSIFQGKPGGKTNVLQLALKTRKPEVVWLIFDKGLAEDAHVRSEWRWLVSGEGREYMAASDQKDLHDELKDLFIANAASGLEGLDLEDKHRESDAETGPSSTSTNSASRGARTRGSPPSRAFKKSRGHRWNNKAAP